jgi:hypothetical protein
MFGQELNPSYFAVSFPSTHLLLARGLNGLLCLLQVLLFRILLDHLRSYLKDFIIALHVECTIHSIHPLSQNNLRIQNVFPHAQRSIHRVQTMLFWMSAKRTNLLILLCCQRGFVMHLALHNHLCHPQCPPAGLFLPLHGLQPYPLAHKDPHHLLHGLLMLHWAHLQLVVVLLNFFPHCLLLFQVLIHLRLVVCLFHFHLYTHDI